MQWNLPSLEQLQEILTLRYARQLLAVAHERYDKSSLLLVDGEHQTR